MRDLFLLIFLVASIPICVFEPYYGVLVWTWLAYFNPHRFTFAYMYDFPVAAAIAVPTLAGLLFARKVNRSFLMRESLLLVMLWVWFVVAYLNATHVPLFAGHIEDARLELVRVSKILLMTFAMILLVTSERRLKWLSLVTALSFGLLALKGAVFGVATVGEFRVWGPPDTFIADNNAFGLALNMVLPMFYFLARIEQNLMFRRILNVAFLAGILCVILTYSRGGLLGLTAVLAAIAWKSKHRIVGGSFFMACVFLVLTLAPEKWMQRMGTLGQEGVDMSAQQRLVSWKTTWNFVQDYPIMGGSFRSLPNVDLFQRYQPGPLPGGFLSSGPHSIYFQVLGEHGFVGFGIYFGLVACCLFSLRGMHRRVRDLPDLHWVRAYSDMLQVSLVGFLVSGAFLGFANFDLYFQLVACTCVLKMMFRQRLVHREVTQRQESLVLAEEQAVGSMMR